MIKEIMNFLCIVTNIICIYFTSVIIFANIYPHKLTSVTSNMNFSSEVVFMFVDLVSMYQLYKCLYENNKKGGD